MTTVLAEVTQSASRLLEALEKLSEWAGSGPGGNGPSGPPSDDVVRAFEEAMTEGPAQETEMAAGVVDFPPVSTAPGPAASMPGPGGDMQVTESLDAVAATPDAASSVSAPGGPDRAASPAADPQQRVDAVRAPEAVDTRSATTAPDHVTVRASRPENPAHELARLLEQFSGQGTVIGPQDLFRAQYLVGMLKVQVHAGFKVSQSTSQGMENVLRQQG